MNRSEIRWVPKGHECEFAGYVLPGGMFYMGSPASRVRDGHIHYLDPAFPIAPRLNSQFVPPVGYWPTYAGMSPLQRLVFLEWMAAGRRFTKIDIGYVFLHFYGLEQRLQEPTLSPSDEADILEEVSSLADRYGHNTSFNSYAAKLTDLLHARAIIRGTAARPQKIGSSTPINLSKGFSIRAFLATRLHGNLTLDFDGAMAGLFLTRRDDGRPVGAGDILPDHLLEEARTLFVETYPNGYLPSGPSRGMLRLEYKPAWDRSSRLVDMTPYQKGTSLPDPLAFDWHDLLVLFGKASAGWRRKLQRLGPLHSRRGQKAMPLSHSDEDWLREQADLSSPLLLSTLLPKLGVHDGKSITKAEYGGLQSYLSGLGLDIAPAAAFASASIRLSQPIIIFRQKKKQNIKDLLPLFGALSLLATYTLSDQELRDIICTTAARINVFARQDTAARHAYIALFRRGGIAPTNRDLAKLFQALAHRPAAEAANAVVAILLDAELIDDETEAWLKKVFEILTLDPQPLHSAMQMARRSPQETLPLVATASATSERGYSITPTPSKPDVGLSLNQALLAKILAETVEVDLALGEVFIAEEPEPQSIEQTPSSDTPEQFVGLPSGLKSIARRLVAQQQWSRREFSDLVKVEGKLPDGVIEALNEWAFDQLGSPLLEEGETIVVDLSLFNEEPHTA